MAKEELIGPIVVDGRWLEIIEQAEQLPGVVQRYKEIIDIVVQYKKGDLEPLEAIYKVTLIVDRAIEAMRGN